MTRIAPQRRRAALSDGPCRYLNGGDLLSQAREGQVPSALRGLTSLFGMGRGVSPSLLPPIGCETRRPRPKLENRKLATLMWGYQNIRQALEALVPVR